MEDIENLFTEDTPLNRVKTWLVGGSDGQTYTIANLVDVDFKKLEADGWRTWEYDAVTEAFDEIVGYKHDYKIDDPEMERRAEAIVRGLAALSEMIEKNPAKYFRHREELGKSVYERLGTTKEELLKTILRMESGDIDPMRGVFSDEHLHDILTDEFLEDVAEDICECAENTDANRILWNDDDVRLAFGRTIKTRLGMDD